jgi:anaerobic selenocysteine-containing dehydrogenase
MLLHIDCCPNPLKPTAKEKIMTQYTDRKTISRRNFIKTSALVGGCAAFASAAATLPKGLAAQEDSRVVYELVRPENIIYSSCLQCHLACQIKCKFWDGTLAKISGNAYSPQNFLPHIPYDTTLEHAVAVDGRICPKGQGGVQTYYDPYRIRGVLKRDGERGSNKWKRIPFDQFINEVVQGGQLFAHLGDNGHYPGFNEVYALRDRNVGKAMAGDAKRVARGEMTLAKFKATHSSHLDTLMDPDHPDLGPKNNGFVFMAGRIEHGRKELMKWFTNMSFGSNNAYEHTTICEQSHHIAYSLMTGHATHHMKADLANCKFVLFWGTGAYSANFGMTSMAQKVTEGKVDRGMKVAVVDPRLSNDAASADWWLPVKPEENSSLALAMMRWILEHERYDKQYLENANKAAAAADDEPTCSDAPLLVKIVDGHPMEYLRAHEVGLGSDQQMVVSRHGQLMAVDPQDETTPVEGDLLVEMDAGGYEVKSVFALLSEEAFATPFEKLAEQCGVDPQTIAAVAREFTAHGKQSAIDFYRGPVQSADGYYSACCIIALNMLIGNADYVGGLINGGSHWHEFGSKKANPYTFKKMHPAPHTIFGPKITREGMKYEDCTLFKDKGYPADRPWFPFTGNVYQEIIPSFAQGYPYHGKILFLHKGTPAFSCPGGNQEIIRILKDQKRMPLFIASDIVIGETSMYADYIVPDLTYLERWGTPHATPDVPTKISKVRQPAGAPLTEEVSVAGYTMPICLESFLLAVADKLQLPGFGSNGLGPGRRFAVPEDWYLRAIANIAWGDSPGEPVPEADEEEMRIFLEAHRHLPLSVFDPKRWRQALSSDEEWRRVVYVLNRGGRFDTFGANYKGAFMRKKLGKMFHFFVEELATQKNSLSGRYFSGLPSRQGQRDASGRLLDRTSRYPLNLITFKEPYGGQSRTISNYWGTSGLQKNNRIWMHTSDAKKLGLKQNQKVRLVSRDNPDGVLVLDDGENRIVDVAGEVQIMEGVRPGVVAVSWHYGHWAYGSNDVYVDGEHIRGDSRRAGGLCPNHVMSVDPVLGDVCVTDPVGGSGAFCNTFVNIIPL